MVRLRVGSLFTFLTLCEWFINNSLPFTAGKAFTFRQQHKDGIEQSEGVSMWEKTTKRIWDEEEVVEKKKKKGNVKRKE